MINNNILLPLKHMNAIILNTLFFLYMKRTVLLKF